MLCGPHGEIGQLAQSLVPAVAPGLGVGLVPLNRNLGGEPVTMIQKWSMRIATERSLALVISVPVLPKSAFCTELNYHLYLFTFSWCHLVLVGLDGLYRTLRGQWYQEWKKDLHHWSAIWGEILRWRSQRDPGGMQQRCQVSWWVLLCQRGKSLVYKIEECSRRRSIENWFYISWFLIKKTADVAAYRK